MLEEPKYSNAIAWADDGTAIEIKNDHLLAEDVLSVYFRHKNIASFIRQLNMYGFNRVNSESSRVLYKQPLFQRGHKENLRLIKRKKSTKENENFNFSTSEADHPEMNSILKEMKKMKDNMAEYDLKLQTLSVENQHLVDENKMLWDAVDRAKSRQQFLADKVQKIVFYLKALNDSSGSSPKALENLNFQKPLLLNDDSSSNQIFQRTNSLVNRLRSSDNFLQSLEQQQPKRHKTNESLDHYDSLPSMSEKINEIDSKKKAMPSNSLVHFDTPSGFNGSKLRTSDFDTYLSLGKSLDQTYNDQDNILRKMNSLQSEIPADDLLKIFGSFQDLQSETEPEKLD